MNVLITGGLGFIGSSLAEHHALAGHSVTIVDDGRNATVSADELPAERIINQSIQQWLADEPICTYDRIIHCASPVGPAGILKYRGRIAHMILSDTVALIKYAGEQAELINISTSEVYGTSGVYKESDDLRVPATPSARIEYAIGKLAAEAECRLSRRLRSISLRPFNVVGARQSRRGGFVLPTFASQAVSGIPLTIYEDGSQQRALTSVDDLAAFILALEPEHFDGRVVNVGNPNNITTITDLAHTVADAALAPPIFEYTTGKRVHGADYEEAEGHIKIPDITLARSMGWEPRITLDELVDDAVRHARAKLPAKAA